MESECRVVLGAAAWNKLIVAVAGKKTETFSPHPFFLFFSLPSSLASHFLGENVPRLDINSCQETVWQEEKTRGRKRAGGRERARNLLK